jgi:iron complex transport system substrate-binding protein
MMMHRFTLICLAASLALTACAGPAAAPPVASQAISLTDGLGHVVSLEHPAQRIVSLAPSNTEILYAVGAGMQIVGRDSYSNFPAAATQVPDVVGGLTTLNTELILAKKPDLVLAAPLTPPEQIAELQKAGLTAYVVPNPKTFNDLYANLETVGKLSGHENEAASLVASLKARAGAVTAAVATVQQKPVVYYELDATDPSAPYTSGPDTFVDLLIRLAGGENFGANLKGDWVQVSVEELLARQPDMILLGDTTYGGVTADQVKARAGWDALKAVQQKQIFIFNDDLVSRPGPRLVDGLEAMAKLLHAELFR